MTYLMTRFLKIGQEVSYYTMINRPVYLGKIPFSGAVDIKTNYIPKNNFLQKDTLIQKTTFIFKNPETYFVIRNINDYLHIDKIIVEK